MLGLRYSHKLPLLRQHFSNRNVAAAYGMMVADNGSNWYISGAPDPHWLNSRLFGELSQVKGSNFEVVKMRGMVTP